MLVIMGERAVPLASAAPATLHIGMRAAAHAVQVFGERDRLEPFRCRCVTSV
jgi:hypothetical protein